MPATGFISPKLICCVCVVGGRGGGEYVKGKERDRRIVYESRGQTQALTAEQSGKM